MPTNVIYSPERIDQCHTVEHVDKTVQEVFHMNYERFEDDRDAMMRKMRRFVLLELIQRGRTDLVVSYLLRSNLIDGV